MVIVGCSPRYGLLLESNRITCFFYLLTLLNLLMVYQIRGGSTAANSAAEVLAKRSNTCEGWGVKFALRPAAVLPLCQNSQRPSSHWDGRSV